MPHIQPELLKRKTSTTFSNPLGNQKALKASKLGGIQKAKNIAPKKTALSKAVAKATTKATSSKGAASKAPAAKSPTKAPPKSPAKVCLPV